MNIESGNAISNMFKTLSICRHGKYDPGRNCLNSDGILQISMATAALSAYYKGPVKIYHSNGPRSKQSATYAASQLGAIAFLGGCVEFSNTSEIYELCSENTMYFTSGEVMNSVLPFLLNSDWECSADYQKTKGRVYAEILRLNSNLKAERVHSLEIE